MMFVQSQEQAFVEQSTEYLAVALNRLGVSSLRELTPITARPPIPLRPIIIRDALSMTSAEVRSISEAYHGEHGVAYFLIEEPSASTYGKHPLFQIADALRDELHLLYPVEHPMEGHSEAVARFGPPDGTLKIYDLSSKRDGSSGYREVAETTEMFSAHNDGLGYAGAVETFFLYSDSPPIWGGFTYFQNMIRLSLDLAAVDYEAFQSLFLPDALRALRPRGKGAICVTSPVLFLNPNGEPQVFFRVSTGEYQITGRPNCEPLERALTFLRSHARPFAAGSSFVHFTAEGHGCIVRNGSVVHGRTDFIDGKVTATRRVLARKWYMTEEMHATYKHVPGRAIG